MLPNCIVNGVAKSGTTAIYSYLGEHPDIFMSKNKELNYFAYDSKIGECNDAHFPIKTQTEYEKEFECSKSYKIRGEASPAYFSILSSAARIHKLIPDVKLITSIRNPVDRAFSGYLMHVRDGKADPKIQDSFTPDKHWVKLGFYSKNLQEYYRIFPSNQIKIVLQDDMKRDTAGTMERIFEYLEVDPHFKPEVKQRHNVGTFPKNHLIQRILLQKETVRRYLEPVTPYFAKKILWKMEKLNQQEPPELPAEHKEYLQNLYREDILRVQDLINRDLSNWLN